MSEEIAALLAKESNMSLCDICIHKKVCLHGENITVCDDMMPKTGWIPISERLPEIHQDVLLSLRSLDVEVGFRAETEPYFYCHNVDGCFIEPQNVIAWMPLPEPYKVESEEQA